MAQKPTEPTDYRRYRRETDRKLLIEGLVVLFVVLALPQGLAGLRRPRFFTRGKTVSASATEAKGHG